jgi:hypothetical protein
MRRFFDFLTGRRLSYEEIYLKGFDAGFNRAFETMSTQLIETASKSFELGKRKAFDDIVRKK